MVGSIVNTEVPVSASVGLKKISPLALISDEAVIEPVIWIWLLFNLI